jgi:hypothetical protein
VLLLRSVPHRREALRVHRSRRLSKPVPTAATVPIHRESRLCKRRRGRIADTRGHSPALRILRAFAPSIALPSGPADTALPLDGEGILAVEEKAQRNSVGFK